MPEPQELDVINYSQVRVEDEVTAQFFDAGNNHYYTVRGHVWRADDGVKVVGGEGLKTAIVIHLINRPEPQPSRSGSNPPGFQPPQFLEQHQYAGIAKRLHAQSCGADHEVDQHEWPHYLEWARDTWAAVRPALEDG